MICRAPPKTAKASGLLNKYYDYFYYHHVTLPSTRAQTEKWRQFVKQSMEMER